MFVVECVYFVVEYFDVMAAFVDGVFSLYLALMVYFKSGMADI